MSENNSEYLDENYEDYLIDIQNWDSLSVEQQYEAVGRYNADSEDVKFKYGSVVVDSMKKVGK